MSAAVLRRSFKWPNTQRESVWAHAVVSATYTEQQILEIICLVWITEEIPCSNYWVECNTGLDAYGYHDAKQCISPFKGRHSVLDDYIFSANYLRLDVQHGGMWWFMDYIFATITICFALVWLWSSSPWIAFLSLSLMPPLPPRHTALQAHVRGEREARVLLPPV